MKSKRQSDLITILLGKNHDHLLGTQQQLLNCSFDFAESQDESLIHKEMKRNYCTKYEFKDKRPDS